jgi:hypothetical protein
MQFRDVDVAQLLSMIGEQFRVKIIVNGDVDEKLKSINLSDMTAEQALETVAEAANLQFRRNAAGVYIVAKSLGPVSGTPPIVPGGTGFGSQEILPGNSDSGLTVSPSLGQNTPTQRLSENDLPELVNPNSRSSRRRSSMIQVRNIKASTLAYWIDPANRPIPDELVVSSVNKSRYTNESFAKPALSAQDQAASQAGSGSGIPAAFTSPYTNPYIQRNAAGRIAPDTRTNAQFGGQRGGGQGGRQQQGGQGGRGGTGGAGGGGGVGAFSLPEGVEEIVAIDPQNVLLVRSTKKTVMKVCAAYKKLLPCWIAHFGRWKSKRSSCVLRPQTRIDSVLTTPHHRAISAQTIPLRLAVT